MQRDGGGGGGVAGSQPMSTAVHIIWHGAQIKFGDLTIFNFCRQPMRILLVVTIHTISKGGHWASKLFFVESTNRKSAHSWAHYAATNAQMPVCKSQIRKFSWLIHKTQICKFLQNTAQLCLKTVLKFVFLFYVTLNLSIIYYICKEKKQVQCLRTWKFLSRKVNQLIVTRPRERNC